MKILKPNAIITYEIIRKGDTQIRQSRGRVTAKRIKTINRLWNLEGKELSAWFPGKHSTRLLGYQIDGSVYIDVAK